MQRVGDYELMEILGEGASGIVKKVKHIKTGEFFALKIFDKEQAKKFDMAQALRKEVLFMKMIEHPNIVKIHEVLSS